jgi:lysozyme
MIAADDPELAASIKRHEGFRSQPYTCPAGRWTIGYGYNLESGMTLEEGEAPRQRSLVEMCYQLGPAGCRRFERMLRALADADYERAADEMLDSRWAEQTPARAEHCAELMREG